MFQHFKKYFKVNRQYYALFQILCEFVNIKGTIIYLKQGEISWDRSKTLRFNFNFKKVY